MQSKRSAKQHLVKNIFLVVLAFWFIGMFSFIVGNGGKMTSDRVGLATGSCANPLTGTIDLTIEKTATTQGYTALLAWEQPTHEMGAGGMPKGSGPDPAGDLNADGYDDILISSSKTIASVSYGVTYLVSGGCR